MSHRRTALSLLSFVLLGAVGCSSADPGPPRGPELETIRRDASTSEPAPATEKRPTQGPLAKLAQAMREAEAETERARKATAQAKALTEERDALKAELAKRVRERDAARVDLAKVKKELRQNMARLLDSEMARVRIEQELLRRKIEVEEKKRVEEQ